MPQGMDSTKSAALPSHEAIENKPGNVTQVGKSEEKKIDQTAMRMAKRAENRIKANKNTNPGERLFTK